ncbi:hypothetical protein [Flavobacterium chryseum]|uniref:hypothetical protein n=1 Tax=Flavobacterium sp. P3160 TaxID=2512113 RepID=UPI001AAD1D62|nr:hypothetical protein [Flavobacterium sp. P3160]
MFSENLIKNDFISKLGRNNSTRFYTYIDIELKYVVTNTTQGGKSVTAEVVWKKL